MTTETAASQPFEYDPDSFGSREYQRLRHMEDVGDFEVTIDWAVKDGLDQYDLDPEEMLETMNAYTEIIESHIGEKG